MDQFSGVQHAEAKAIIVDQTNRIFSPARTVPHRLEMACPTDQMLNVSPGQIRAVVEMV